MTTRPDPRNLLRAGIAFAVWTALVLLLIGSIWELRSGAAERLTSPAHAYEVESSRSVPFRTDEVEPTDQTKYLKVVMYAPLFAQLPPDLSEKLRKGTTRASSTKRDDVSVRGKR